MVSVSATGTQLYLDDLAAGQVYRSNGDPVVVTTEMIKTFAREFDPQPFHLDEAAAAKTLFGGLAASGWHTTALTMRLFIEAVPLAGGIIGAGVDELRWPRPVRPGDRLRVESEVLEVRPSRTRPEQGMVKIRTTTLNQDDQPVQVFTGNLVVPRRTPG